MNIKDNQKSWFRLLTGVDKVKKNLNENDFASLSIECLMGDYDLRTKLSRTEYLEMLEKHNFFTRPIELIEQVMKEAKVTKDDLDDIEWLGSGLRVSHIRKVIREYFKKDRLSNTMNAEEGSAKVPSALSFIGSQTHCVGCCSVLCYPQSLEESEKVRSYGPPRDPCGNHLEDLGRP